MNRIQSASLASSRARCGGMGPCPASSAGLSARPSRVGRSTMTRSGERPGPHWGPNRPISPVSMSGSGAEDGVDEGVRAQRVEAGVAQALVVAADVFGLGAGGQLGPDQLGVGRGQRGVQLGHPVIEGASAHGALGLGRLGPVGRRRPGRLRSQPGAGRAWSRPGSAPRLFARTVACTVAVTWSSRWGDHGRRWRWPAARRSPPAPAPRGCRPAARSRATARWTCVVGPEPGESRSATPTSRRASSPAQTGGPVAVHHRGQGDLLLASSTHACDPRPGPDQVHPGLPVQQAAGPDRPAPRSGPRPAPQPAPAPTRHRPDSAAGTSVAPRCSQNASSSKSSAATGSGGSGASSSAEPHPCPALPPMFSMNANHARGDHRQFPMPSNGYPPAPRQSTGYGSSLCRTPPRSRRCQELSQDGCEHPGIRMMGCPGDIRSS